MDIKNYPRLSELAKECNEDNFFSKSLEAGNSNFLEQTEEALSHLNGEAWQTFKDKVKSYAEKPHQNRRYSQVVHVLNEVKGYNYLKDQGYASVEFIINKGQPDLYAEGGMGEALMEVKTIDWSDYFLDGVYNGLNEESVSLENLPQGLEFPECIRGKIRYENHKLFFKGMMSEDEKDALLRLSDDGSYCYVIKELFDETQPKALVAQLNVGALKDKLESTVKKAKKQLTSCELAKKASRKICYLFINLDPPISKQHYINELAEVDKYLNALKNEDPEIEIIQQVEEFGKRKS